LTTSWASNVPPVKYIDDSIIANGRLSGFQLLLCFLQNLPLKRLSDKAKFGSALQKTGTI